MHDWTKTIKEFKKGNKKAFRMIYDEYYEMLLHISMQYISNREDAKEAVQDAFVKLWENRSSVREDANIRNFLYTIAKNNCLNLIKKKQVVLQSNQSELWMEMHYQYEALSRMGYNDMEFKELQGKIQQAVEKLPGACGIVFKMSRYDQLKNKEIAKKLNISEKTVEAHMSKALRVLREDLKDYLPIISAISYFFS